MTNVISEKWNTAILCLIFQKGDILEIKTTKESFYQMHAINYAINNPVEKNNSLR